MRGAINHILTQSILLVSLTSSGPWKMKRRIMNPHLPPNAEFQGTLGSLFKVQGLFICHIIVIQGITRSEMQSNQVRSVDSAKQ